MDSQKRLLSTVWQSKIRNGTSFCKRFLVVAKAFHRYIQCLFISALDIPDADMKTHWAYTNQRYRP
ncbi:MAG: hypothetical protein RMY28_019290 [Nostoc sp. ChiSLP01]|nr:hypothetical protein [Nostoc sp. CmiSLP01]MDZ8287140.1 hypothetical protein [Nostoc sp. ChiSLP01]